MKKFYASLAAVALTASSAFAVNFTVDGFKTLENVNLNPTQKLIAPEHNASEVTLRDCFQAPKSRVDVPIEFEGNIEDFKIILGYDANENQLSMPSDITVTGTDVKFANFLGYSGMNVVGSVDPEGNITINAGQVLRTASTYKYVLVTADSQGNVSQTGTITFTMNEAGTMLSTDDAVAIGAYAVSTGQFAGVLEVLFDAMMVAPNATVEYSYKAYTSSGVSATATTVKQDVWVGFGSSNNRVYSFITSLVPADQFSAGYVSQYIVGTTRFVAVNSLAVPSFQYSSGSQSGLQSGDMMFVNTNDEGFYTFPFIGTYDQIQSVDDLKTITFKGVAALNPYTSLSLFDSFIGQELSDVVVTLKTEDPAGVDNVIANDPAKAPAQYFNLQGMQLSQPEAGQVVIVKEGKSAKKVIF